MMKSEKKREIRLINGDFIFCMGVIKYTESTRWPLVGGSKKKITRRGQSMEDPSKYLLLNSIPPDITFFDKGCTGNPKHLSSCKYCVKKYQFSLSKW